MVVVKCDNCGKVLKEPIFRLIMTDGSVTKEAHFCDEHAQKLHDAVLKYAHFNDTETEGEDVTLD